MSVYQMILCFPLNNTYVCIWTERVLRIQENFLEVFCHNYLCSVYVATIKFEWKKIVSVGVPFLLETTFSSYFVLR